MVDKNVNNRLYELYKVYNNHLINLYNNQAKDFGACSSPLFMWAFDDYLEASVKVLIVGQETNGWGKIEEKNSVEELQNWYKEFRLGQNANFGGDYEGRAYLTSPFWNFARQIYLRANDLDWQNRAKLGFLWTNISKFDINTDSPSNEIRKLDRAGFGLLREELKIIQPDIVLFLTGNEYNTQLSEILHLNIDNTFHQELNISKLTDALGDFPLHTYKVNHPRYLYSVNKHIDILDELEKIIRPKNFNVVLQEYNQRIETENALMKALPMQEGMKRRDEFLLSVGEETAVFLNNLIKAAKPKTILEIGTSYGYSTLWLAEAAQSYGGKVITLENDAHKSDYAQQKIQEAGLDGVVSFVVGDALEYLKNTTETFDFVLLDLWKELYIPSFDLFFPKLNAGTYIISDNMLLPPHHQSEMEIYRNHLKNTNAFDSVLLPIGSGIEVSCLRK